MVGLVVPVTAFESLRRVISADAVGAARAIYPVPAGANDIFLLLADVTLTASADPRFKTPDVVVIVFKAADRLFIATIPLPDGVILILELAAGVREIIP